MKDGTSIAGTSRKDQYLALLRCVQAAELFPDCHDARTQLYFLLDSVLFIHDYLEHEGWDPVDLDRHVRLITPLPCPKKTLQGKEWLKEVSHLHDRRIVVDRHKKKILIGPGANPRSVDRMLKAFQRRRS